MYDSSMKHKWDNKSVLDYAKEEGRRMVAIELIKEGSSIDFIAKVTKLPIAEIEKLIASVKREN
jgi:hypothetical protein